MIPQSHNVEVWISRILRTGIVLSASFMVLGLVIYATQTGAAPSLANNPSLGELLGVLFGLSASNTLPLSLTYMYCGLVLLILTPFVRVLTTVVTLTIERDWRYVGLSTFVFLMLLGELFIAFR